MFVPTFVNVTFAPGTMALEVSRTVPMTEAVSNWASAVDEIPRIADRNRQANRMMYLYAAVLKARPYGRRPYASFVARAFLARRS